MNRNIVIFIVIILIAASAILGYTIYQRVNPSKTPKLQSQQTVSPSPVLRASARPGSPQPPPSPSSAYLDTLSAEEKTIISMNFTREEIQKNHDLIVSAAKTAEFLDVAKCEVRPVVLKIKQNTAIKLRNQNSVSRTISIGTNLIETVGANSTKEVKLTQNDVSGALHGYGCDGKQAGFILITE